MKKIIVVDTSVLVSGLLGPGGPAREVLRRCLQGSYVPLISNPLFLEYEAVSSRSKIQKLSPLSSAEIRELLDAIYNVSQWVPIYYLWRPNLLDENDNFLVELAVAGNASCIVTNNTRDLKASELSFPEFSVLTPAQLLRG